MRDRRAEIYAAGCDQADSVFQVGLCADVRKQVPQATLTQQVDIQFQGGTKPRDADQLTSGANGVDCLSQRLSPGQSLFGAAASTLEDHVRAVSVGQVSNSFDDIAVAGIQRVVGSQLFRNLA